MKIGCISVVVSQVNMLPFQNFFISKWIAENSQTASYTLWYLQFTAKLNLQYFGKKNIKIGAAKQLHIKYNFVFKIISTRLSKLTIWFYQSNKF